MQQEKLAEDLSNCRAIESSLKDAFTSIKVRDATHPAALFPGLVDVHDQCEYFSATTAALTKMHSAPTCHTSKPSLTKRLVCSTSSRYNSRPSARKPRICTACMTRAATRSGTFLFPFLSCSLHHPTVCAPQRRWR